MMALVASVGIIVATFARRYLKGDRLYGFFFVRLAVLISAVMVMVSADHLLLFLAAWGISNAALAALMMHKSEWLAARASGQLAARNFLLGTACIAGGFVLLFVATGSASIQTILSTATLSPVVISAMLLMLIGAMTQSAIWPFHRWLLSSLNAPTSVSAIMHAGLINGGGFLLARFSPLYLADAAMLNMIFILGVGTALTGTLWKLMQNDIKRMLASSTMGQMGFMLAQCGLGLFPAAIAHLCWHGFFKANLFLSSGSAAQEKRLDFHYPPTIPSFVASLVCGTLGAFVFSLAGGKVFFAADTTAVLVAVALIAGAQLALPMLREKPLGRLPLALGFTALMGGLYGLSVKVVAAFLAPLGMMQPQPLNVLHIAAVVLLAAAWLIIIFGRQPGVTRVMPAWILKLYVQSLNASQPHPATVTVHRNDYRY